MTIETAEKLKSALTDRYVVVEEGVLELRRFVGRTGFVKTVNMNGRAVVQFDNSEDIGWYDIDPAYLKVVDKPEPAAKKEAVKESAKVTPAAKKEPGTPVAKKKSGGMSPLELARQQGAGGKGNAAKAPKKATGLSPLEQARQQGAAGKSSTAKTEAATKTKAKKPAASGKKLSPLEMARMQDGSGAKTAEPETSDAEAVEETTDTAETESARTNTEKTEPDTAAIEKPQKSDAPSASPDGKQLSPLELARLQGPFKG